MKKLLFALVLISASVMAQVDEVSTDPKLDYEAKVSEQLSNFDKQYDKYQHPVLPNKEAAQKLAEWNLERAKLENTVRKENCASFNVPCPTASDEQKNLLRAQYEADVMSTLQKHAERFDDTRKPDSKLTKVMKKLHLRHQTEYSSDDEAAELAKLQLDFDTKNCEDFKDSASCKKLNIPMVTEISSIETRSIDTGNITGIEVKVKPLEIPDLEGQKQPKILEKVIRSDYKPETCVWSTQLPRKIITLPSIPACGPATKIKACVAYVVCERRQGTSKFVRMSTCSAENCGKNDAIKCTKEDGYRSDNVADDVTSFGTKKIRDDLASPQ